MREGAIWEVPAVTGSVGPEQAIEARRSAGRKRSRVFMLDFSVRGVPEGVFHCSRKTPAKRANGRGPVSLLAFGRSRKKRFELR